MSAAAGSTLDFSSPVFLKILEPADWASVLEMRGKINNAQAEGKAISPSLMFDGTAFDKESGYMHASANDDQLFAVFDFFFPGRTDLMVLYVDLSLSAEGRELLAQGKLKYDHVKVDGWREDDFPHLYGPMPINCIAGVRARTEFNHPWKPAPSLDTTFFKVLYAAEWEAVKDKTHFEGTALDKKDGYIHFSTADELDLTLQKYYPADRTDVIILEIDLNASAEGQSIKKASAAAAKSPFRYDWVQSRAAYFPHLYVPLPLDCVVGKRMRDGSAVA